MTSPPNAAMVFESDLGPALACASMPSGPGEKAFLVKVLTERVRPAIVPGRGLRLATGPLGRPLLEGTAEPCSVSFSRQGDRTWAALSRTGRVGVDAACPEEFEGTYPFHRVFHALEWAGAATFCAGDRSAAAALLWTLKEAAVKGLGVGFNGMDPLEVKARVLGADGSGIHSLVEAGSARLYARSRRHRGRWLSLALEEAGP